MAGSAPARMTSVLASRFRNTAYTPNSPVLVRSSAPNRVSSRAPAAASSPQAGASSAAVRAMRWELSTPAGPDVTRPPAQPLLVATLQPEAQACPVRGRRRLAAGHQPAPCRAGFRAATLPLRAGARG